MVGAELAGPALASVLFTVAVALAFGVRAASLLVSLVLLGGLRLRSAPHAAGCAQRFAPLIGQIREGARWLAGSPMLRAITVGSVVLAFADTAWFSILVLYVLRVLDRSERVYGHLVAIGAAGGSSAVRSRGGSRGGSRRSGS